MWNTHRALRESVSGRWDKQGTGEQQETPVARSKWDMVTSAGAVTSVVNDMGSDVSEGLRRGGMGSDHMKRLIGCCVENGDGTRTRAGGQLWRAGRTWGRVAVAGTGECVVRALNLLLLGVC